MQGPDTKPPIHCHEFRKPETCAFEITGANGPRMVFAYDTDYRMTASRSGPSGNLDGTYGYDQPVLLASRTVNQSGSPSTTTLYVYDLKGHVIAETDTTGATQREYIWMDDLPVAVVAGVNTATPTLYYVHADHLNRPARMTTQNQAWVWDVIYSPFGATSYIWTNPATLDLRFPGQWFQLESGLAYNWHRHYDPTIGRYIQPDLLGLQALLSDGPSVYNYVGGSPLAIVDPDGLMGSGGASGRYTVPCGRCSLIYDNDRFKGPHTHWQCPGQPQGCIKKDGSLCDGSAPPPEEIKECLRERNRVPPDYKFIGGVCIGAAAVGVCLAFPQFCVPALGVGGAATAGAN